MPRRTARGCRSPAAFRRAPPARNPRIAADYLTAGSTSSLDQPIGGAGLQGAFGVVFNNSFLVAIAIDTSNMNTLNVFSGPLGGTLTGGPIKSITKVQEARIFPATGYSFIITLVQNSDPGQLSVLTGQLK